MKIDFKKNNNKQYNMCYISLFEVKQTKTQIKENL